MMRPFDIEHRQHRAVHRIADAQITYGSKRRARRANRMGWIARFFNELNPRTRHERMSSCDPKFLSTADPHALGRLAAVASC